MLTVLNKNNSFCNLYEKECMGIFCSVTPDIENCHYKTQNVTPSFKIHYAPGGEWGSSHVSCCRYYTTDVMHTGDKTKVTCKHCLRILNKKIISKK